MCNQHLDNLHLQSDINNNSNILCCCKCYNNIKFNCPYMSNLRYLQKKNQFGQK